MVFRPLSFSDGLSFVLETDDLMTSSLRRNRFNALSRRLRALSAAEGWDGFWEGSKTGEGALRGLKETARDILALAGLDRSAADAASGARTEKEASALSDRLNDWARESAMAEARLKNRFRLFRAGLYRRLGRFARSASGVLERKLAGAAEGSAHLSPAELRDRLARFYRVQVRQTLSAFFGAEEVRMAHGFERIRSAYDEETAPAQDRLWAAAARLFGNSLVAEARPSRRPQWPEVSLEKLSCAWLDKAVFGRRTRSRVQGRIELDLREAGGAVLDALFRGLAMELGEAAREKDALSRRLQRLADGALKSAAEAQTASPARLSRRRTAAGRRMRESRSLLEELERLSFPP